MSYQRIVAAPPWREMDPCGVCLRGTCDQCDRCRLIQQFDSPPPPRPPTAIGMADDRFDELFAFIDTLPVADLRRLVNRLRRDVPPWAWR